jgi:hypothetical protein
MVHHVHAIVTVACRPLQCLILPLVGIFFVPDNLLPLPPRFTKSQMELVVYEAVQGLEGSGGGRDGFGRMFDLLRQELSHVLLSCVAFSVLDSLYPISTGSFFSG